MKLTHTIYQEKDGNPFQCLEITIDYCNRTRIVEEVISVVAYEFGKERIDLSDLFMRYFDSDLDKLIMETDWDLLAAETAEEKRSFIEDIEAEDGSIISDMQSLGSLLNNHKELSK